MMSYDIEQRREFSSFRDPSGYVFVEDKALYRCINSSYFPQYRAFMNGLYDELIKFNAIIPHQELQATESQILIQPEEIPYISYPYDWSFGELKDAAILTLKIHRRAMRHNLILKDASAYNIQFRNGQPLLIDTLSFDLYHEGEPWGAYGQFCRHFLAPLLLMCERDIRLNRLLALFIDGIPLDLAKTLLNGKGGFFARQHIIWHSNSIVKHESDGRKLFGRWKILDGIQISRERHLALIESLIRGIEALKLKNVATEWSDYYAHTNYTPEANGDKNKIVRKFLNVLKPQTTWDLGANDGTFSRLALECGSKVVAFDIDPLAVERNYQSVKRTHENMLPLVLDLTNPSPGIGFANHERKTISERQKPDCVMALAVIHHLAISNNLPLEMLAKWLASLCKSLIIEFVPKEDSQVQLLLATRRDIFPNYNQEAFETIFTKYFRLKAKENIADSKRIIYCFDEKEEENNS